MTSTTQEPTQETVPKLYIITHHNYRKGGLRTEFVRSFTTKNIYFVKKNQGYFNYLYDSALKILQTDVNSRYTTYFKKKRNGKKRRIDIPDEGLKKFMRDVNHYFVDLYNFIFPKYIYAYVKERSAIDAAAQHCGATRIMGFDIENFFGSCTLSKVMYSLEQLYPFCLMDQEQLETIVQACMIYYDGDYRLPQGAPTSPLLSNLAFIPVDMELNDRGYTRYADDIFYSIWPYTQFYYNNMVDRVSRILEYYGFKLNPDKTRCLKLSDGNVKVLGVSVGFHRISIGSKKKQIIKAKIFSFLMDTKNGKLWSHREVQQLQGQLAHCKCIEPDFIEKTIKKYEEKTNVSYEQSVKLCIQNDT